MSNKFLSVYLFFIISIILAACHLFFIISIILAACQPPAPVASEPIVETLVVTEVVEATPVEVIQVKTPTPEPQELRTLVICTGEPDTLYKFATRFPHELAHLEAIEGGTIDRSSFAYRPVILEKLPSLADGDAELNAVTVREGDTVVDGKGEIVILDSVSDPAIMLTPAGGGNPIPYQGGEFEMDQLSARFVLLPDLIWSDGTPLTAADSVYAFNLVADPATPGGDKATVQHTAAYEAIDDLTIIWTGLPGFMSAEYSVHFFSPAPEHIWGQYTPAELLEVEVSHLKPLGWGPYMVEEWVPGESITMNKNPNYFRAAEGLPRFDTLIFRFVGTNTNENVAALLAGECDVVERSTHLDDQTPLLIDLHNAGQVKATFTTGTGWEHIDFGIQHVDYDDGYQIGVDRPDFFSDVRTRQAFTMCMDRQALVDELTYGQSIVLDSYVPPQHPLYNPEVTHYDFDIAAGSALLEEVGWVDEDGDPSTSRLAQGVANVPDGTQLAVTYQTVTSRAPIASILQESLALCGIRVNVQALPPSEVFKDGPEGPLFGRQFDLGGFLWFTGVEPPCNLYLSNDTPGPANADWTSIQDDHSRTFGDREWAGDNHQGFADQAYDTACLTARSSLPGQPEYEIAHLEAQRIFAEQLPVAPLYPRILLAASRPDLCGLIMDPTTTGEFWNIEEFDYGEGCEG
jgi:peptide/nickel transport system substrate-binding protein